MDTSGSRRLNLPKKWGFSFKTRTTDLFAVSPAGDCLGPKNLGLPDEEVEARILQAAEAVGLTAVLDENRFSQ